jgi:hypothetical protein
MNGQLVDNFVSSYLATAEWVTVDGTTRGFTKTSKQIAKNECIDFITKVFANFSHEDALKILTYQGNDVSCLAGHDFFLTRNHHGAGFWDKEVYNELSPNACDLLTQIAQSCGTAEVYNVRGYLVF